MKMFNRLTALITLFLYCFTGFADQTQTNTLSIGKPNSQNKSIIFQKSGNKPVIRMNGTTGVLQFSNDGTNFKDIGSGGGGFKNFVTNFDIEADTSGYSAFKDAAATTPVDGTGGSPTTITLSKTTTVGEVLSQTGSLKVAKSAANGQGEGFSYDVTIDRGWFPGPATISFLQDTTHASYSAGDMVVCVYDKDLASLVVISGADVGSCKSVPKQKGLFQATFNMSTSDDYRVIWYVSTTNASAYNLFFDEVNVNPLLRTDGVAVSDPALYTPTSNGFGTLSNVHVFQQRTGQMLKVFGRFTTGNVAASEARISFPTGLSTSLGTTGSMVGRWFINDSTGNTRKSGPLYTDSTASTYVTFQSDDYTTAASPFNAGLNGNVVTSNNNTVISIYFDVPISQWSGASNIINSPRVECATNTSTATTVDDTTSFSNNCDGSLVQNITASLKRRIRWQYAMQPSDQYLIQLSSNKITWITISGERHLVNNTYNYASYKDQNGTTYGIGRLSGVNSTDMDLYFGQYAVDAGGAYGAAGSAYSAQGGTAVYYRVLKLSGVAANAYAEAVPGVSPGFVSHLGLKGFTDGTWGSSGYTSERIVGNGSGVTNNNSAAYVTCTSVSLTAGRWMLVVNGRLSGSGTNSGFAGISTANNAGTGLDFTNFSNVFYGSALDANNNAGVTGTHFESLSSSATRYLVFQPNSNATMTCDARLTAIRLP